MPQPTKVFTVEQANRTLPLVSRIVQDIVRLYPRWVDKVNEYETVAAHLDAERPDPRAAQLERDVHTLATEVEGCRRELAELGIVLKDPEIGLVDFPGEIGGRRVWLCWRLGEPSVEHWHELTAGYAGRRRLAPHPISSRVRAQ
jgi:hypothetical protein